MGFKRQSLLRARKYRKALAGGIRAQQTAENITVGAATFGTGNVLEVISSVCDGTTVNTLSGAFTFQNVTGGTNLSNSYADLNGSKISYVPPEGTQTVIYQFNYQSGWADSHAIHHTRFYIDGVEITNGRRTNGGTYREGMETFVYPIHITGTDDNATGTRSSWTEPKELKIMARDYSDGNELRVHITQYWDGGGTDIVVKPVLTLIAIG